MMRIIRLLFAAAAATNCPSFAPDFATRSDISRVEFEIGDLGTLPVALSSGEYRGKLEWAESSGTVLVQARALHSSADCTLYESSPLNVTLPAGDDTVAVRMQLLNLFPRSSDFNKRPIIVLTTVSPQRASAGQQVVFLVEARDYDSDAAPTLSFTHNGASTLQENCETDNNARLCMVQYVIDSSDTGTLQLSITASDGTLSDTATVTHEVVARSNALDATFFIDEGPYLTDMTEGNTLLHADGPTNTTHSAKVHDETATNLTYSWQVQGNGTYCNLNDMTFQPSGSSGAVGSVGDVVSVTHVPSVFPGATDMAQFECEITLTATDELGQTATTDFVHLISSDPTPSHPYITLVYHTANDTHRMSVVRAHSPYDHSLELSWDASGFATSSGSADMQRISANTYEWQHAIAISSNVQGTISYEIEDLTTNLTHESASYTIAALSGQQRRRRLLEDELDGEDDFAKLVAGPGRSRRLTADDDNLAVAATLSLSNTGAVATVEHTHDEDSDDDGIMAFGIAFGSSLVAFIVTCLV